MCPRVRSLLLVRFVGLPVTVSSVQGSLCTTVTVNTVWLLLDTLTNQK